MRSERFRAPVMVVAAMPPPLHGQSAVTAAVVDRLKLTPHRVVVADTSPKILARGVGYHWRRMRQTFKAISRMLLFVGTPSVALYSVVESNWGQLYNLAILLVARILNFKIFIHHHTSRHFHKKRSLFQFVAKLAGRDAVHIVSGPSMAADLLRLYPVCSHIQISNNAWLVGQKVNVKRQTPIGRKLFLGLLSNLEREKGLDLAIATAIEAMRVGLDVALILGGPVVGSEAHKSISEAASILNDRLVVRGGVYGSDKDQFYRDLDVFLFPTTYQNENQPLVLIEAMSYGLPIITTNQGYILEWMDGGGVVVRDASDFVSTAVETLKAWSINFEDALVLGEAAERKYLEHRKHGLDQLEKVVCSLSDDTSAG